MTRLSTFLKELEQESITTRKMLERIPNDQFDWKPHPKSMTIRQLSTHIAELPSWATMAIMTDGLDFEASPYQPKEINDRDELLAYFEEKLEDGRSQLKPEHEGRLDETWVLRSGDQILSRMTKAEVIRMAWSQIIHHRAQLGVYLRLLDIPIPGSYGPSADEA